MTIQDMCTITFSINLKVQSNFLYKLQKDEILILQKSPNSIV